MNLNFKRDNFITLFLILLFLIFLLYTNYNNKYKDSLHNINYNNFFFKNKKNNIISNNILSNNILENNFLKIKISNISGQINEVLIKNYKNYNNKDYNKKLFLIKNQTSLFGFIFKDMKNNIYDTNNLIFTPKFYEKEKSIILIMKAYLKKDNYIEYIYILDKYGYNLSFFVRSNKLNLFQKIINIYYQHNTLNLEKNKIWENNYTQLYFFNKKLKKINYLSDSNFDEKHSQTIDWISIKQQFFTSILSLDNPIKKVSLTSNLLTNNYYLKQMQIYGSIYQKNNQLNFSSKWYFGPLSYNILKKYNNHYEDIIPFGWGILKWINIYFFLNIFQLLSKSYLNYGYIIIIMTCIVKIILSPITYKQYKLSAMMKIIKPQIDNINDKYKNENPLKKQKMIIDLYRKTGINPISGCLPAILQIPIFYALFKFFPTLIELRGKSFLWADDLTSYDSILQLPFYIPIYGNHVSLFTLLYTLALLIYTKISGNNNFSSEKSIPNMNFMIYIVPVMMLLFINNYSSGLSLYYFISNIINIIIIFLIKKILIKEDKINILNNNI